MSGFVCHYCRCSVDFQVRGDHDDDCPNAYHNETLLPDVVPERETSDKLRYRDSARRKRETVTATQAHARTSDPWTSHAAARSITAEELRETQEAVLACFVRFGPMHHERLIERYAESYAEAAWPRQSVSGLRTRTKELVDADLVEDTGQFVRLPSGRRSIVWQAR